MPAAQTMPSQPVTMSNVTAQSPSGTRSTAATR